MPLASNDFVHLHTHSEFSLLDGLGRITDLVDEANAKGFDSLAITDHGALHGAVAFHHAATAAARTEAAPLARERHEALGPAPRTTQAREAAGQPAALKKVTELLLHEPRQPFAVAQARGVCAEGLEVVAHDVIQRA